MTQFRTVRLDLTFWIAAVLMHAVFLLGQSGTSSALAGTITDTSGAVMANATVTAVEVDTKATRTGQTNSEGRFLFSQVNPGTYRVTVEAPGFAAQTSQPTPVAVGRTGTLNFSLQISSASQNVEVRAEQGLLSLDNPNTTTTLEEKTIKSLPNPGQDLTYIAQFAQGALMNTAGSSNDAKAAGGYGNVEFNGLPATSNGYILDGYRHQRSLAGTQHRALHQPRHWARRNTRSNRQYEFLRRRSGKVRRLSSELLHQVGRQQVSRRPIRGLERVSAQWRRLLSSCERHARQHQRKSLVPR